MQPTTTTTVDINSSPSSSKTIVATIALCICSLIHAFLLINIFPYAGYMAMALLPHLTTETAGPYAGLLASAFMAGRTLSAYPFGRMADVYGRVMVLVVSLVLSGFFSLMFGMSHSFGMAMLWRFLLGLSNGIVGTVKTVVSEMATATNSLDPNNNPSSSTISSSLETRMMGMVVGMRAWGFLISPAIGGWLAEPIQQYPSLFEDSNNNSNNNNNKTSLAMLFKPWLLKFPFILPNLVGAILCLGAAALVVWGVDETLPDEKRHPILTMPKDSVNFVRSKFGRCLDGSTADTPSATTKEDMEDTPLLGKSSEKLKTMARQEPITVGLPTGDSTEQRQGTDKLIIQQQDNASTKPTTMQCLWQRHNTRQHLISYWLFSFAVVCLDESFPLFCISKQGGLGLSEGIIGKILSMAGLFFAVFQYAVYVKTVDRFGLYASLWIGCGLGFCPVLFIPLSLSLNHNQQTSGRLEEEVSALNWPTFLFLVTIMAVSKVFSCMFFTSISIALNKTVDTTQRAALNGLATVGSSIAKGLAPIMAGVLVSVAYSSVGQAFGATSIIFAVVGLMGLSVMRSLTGIQ